MKIQHVNHGCILINNSPRCASDAGSISSVYESSYSMPLKPSLLNPSANTRGRRRLQP